MDGVLNDMDREIGIENVKSIHLNDSAVGCGTNKDRHANLGKGNLGSETIKKILHNEKLKEIPFILETPALKDSKSTLEEVETLKLYIN